MNAENGNGVDGAGPAYHPPGRPPSGVDLDLLADYSCGVLDHASSETVAARIATDPTWAAAYRDLTDADAAVRIDLAALAGGTPAMPADVAARLDAALAAASQPPAALPVSPAPAPPVSPAPVVPISLAARRRRMRIAAVAAVAAAVVGVAGVGVGVVVNQSASERQSAASDSGAAREGGNAAEAPRAVPSPTRRPKAQSGEDEAAPPAKANPVIRRSGRNYTAATLRQVLTSSPSPTPDRSRPGSSPEPHAAPIVPLPRELIRLNREADRMRCLETVRNRYGAYPTLMDYARYEGTGAVIMVLPVKKGASRPRILVVGPDCGISGTDQRHIQD